MPAAKKTTTAIIEQGCSQLSPPLAIANEADRGAPEVRLLCQRPGGHAGAHSMVFRWEGDTDPLVDTPPWRGIT